MNFREKIIRIVAELSRFIVGATFLFSGFVKAVDPLGFSYKIQDYLLYLHFQEFSSLALFLAILLVVLEFSVGAFLLLGIYKKWASVVALLFMLFFTPFTLWIALENPVKDCGCFGDALVIGNWATFYKNIVLFIGTIALFFYHRFVTSFLSQKAARLAGIYCLIFGFLFPLYTIYNLPVFDFRPYKIGANIPELMHFDAEKGDVYENVFIYSKDGKNKRFSEDNYPWNDSTWTFVEMKSNLIKKGQTPKIEDFAIFDISVDSNNMWHESGDITQQILSDSTYVFLMISPTFTKMRPHTIEAFEAINKFARKRDYRFYVLNSWTFEQIAAWSEENKTSDFAFSHGDERVLKTMIRSNPGLMLLKKGTVIGKWSNRHIPSPQKMEKFMANQNSKDIRFEKTLIGLRGFIILLIFITPLIVIKWSDYKQNKK